MKTKVIPKLLLLSLALMLILVAGCEKETTPPQSQEQGEPDTVSSPSVADNAEELKKAISNEGTWIIILTQDIEVEEDITLEGEYTNGKKDDEGNEIIQRKVALYAQDEDRNITERYTLTAPKFTIKSPKASIQHGTFKGDLYVEAENFELVDTTVDGDLYFTNEEAQSTFEMDEESKITGKRELVTQQEED